MRTRRNVGLLLAAVLVVGIVVAVVWGRGGSGGGGSTDLTVVEGVIGSEKKPFFDDPAVQAEFAANGYTVKVTTAGSRQIATTADLTGVDFVFPSSAPAALKVSQRTGVATSYSPFYSPMAVATFAPLAPLLEEAGIVSQDGAGVWHLDVAQYLAAVRAGTRWSDLPGADTAYPSPRELLLSSTDIRSSNSAAMYLSIASYVVNGDNVVTGIEQQDAIIDEMAQLFLGQGFSASSSEDPFADYLSQGIGSKPLVMVYEAQFLGQQMTDHDTGTAAVTPDMMLMYPSPTVLSKHTVIPLTPAGDAVGQLLMTDPALARLAARHGFRPADPAVFASVLTDRGLAVPPTPVGVVEPPSYEVLESIIQAISDRYTSSVARNEEQP
ncbi:MAG: hypothetical protein FWH11_12710 [Micrococcales bacterium]|nr:hypothetical protein [Micrococcales bacterium]